MTEGDLREVVRAHLTEQMQQVAGSVLYTPLSTIKPGAVYIMGLNPGGRPSDDSSAIIDNIAPSEGQSSYTHECWNADCDDPGTCVHLDGGRIRPDAEVDHQRHMRQIAEALETPLVELPSCNAIFAKSGSLAELKSQTKISALVWWDCCWPVHQYLLSQVRPHLIVTLGYGERTSALGLLRRKTGYMPVRQFGDKGVHGGKTFNADLPLSNEDSIAVTVVGVPHPSWYSPGPVLKHQLWEVVRGLST